MHRSTLISALSGAFGLFLSIAVVSDGRAQDTDESPEQPAQTEERASDGPFIEAMSRLAIVLGSMHFLRELCVDDENALWRGEMGKLLEAQKPNGPDRRRLIASFNNGYRAYESTYRHCTAAARLAHNRFQAEGAKLSRDIVARYGN